MKTSPIERFAKTVKNFKPLTTFAKSFTLDIYNKFSSQQILICFEELFIRNQMAHGRIIEKDIHLLKLTSLRQLFFTTREPLDSGVITLHLKC